MTILIMFAIVKKYPSGFNFSSVGAYFKLYEYTRGALMSIYANRAVSVELTHNKYSGRIHCNKTFHPLQQRDSVTAQLFRCSRRYIRQLMCEYLFVGSSHCFFCLFGGFFIGSADSSKIIFDLCLCTCVFLLLHHLLLISRVSLPLFFRARGKQKS